MNVRNKKPKGHFLFCFFLCDACLHVPQLPPFHLRNLMSSTIPRLSQDIGSTIICIVQWRLDYVVTAYSKGEFRTITG